MEAKLKYKIPEKGYEKRETEKVKGIYMTITGKLHDDREN